jgi:hypothetical protein
VMVGTAHQQPPAVVESKDLSVPWWSIGAGIAVVVAVAAGGFILRGRRSQAQP